MVTEARGRFDGKVAVVTGAGSGIGAATAERLAGVGAEFVLLDAFEDALVATATGSTPKEGGPAPSW